MAAANSTSTERLPGPELHETLPEDCGQPGQYLLLDAALDDTLLSSLYSERHCPGWTREALLQGTPHQALASAGPHLVRIWPGSTVLNDIMRRMDESPLGILLIPTEGTTWEAMVEHCRSCLTGTSVDGDPLLVRWYEPRWMRALLNVLDAGQRKTLAGPCQALVWRGVRGWYRWACEDTTAAPRPLVFDKGFYEHLDGEHQRDVAAFLANAYRDYLTQDPLDRYLFIYNALVFGNTMGLTRLDHQERWIRLNLRHGERFWQHDERLARLLDDDALTASGKLDTLEALSDQGAIA
ncbi:DUF4123 domain-containing protein [Zestomonas carbonaria]|uniref:DUF4123 domain-containing protein n=1 Tax=Zestomonas carbonaria TaxID=2762745 RepID=A0A7U7ESW0_9GAMM|nr:DUF4123 domain-containing protein [Pseudomonas carbonaria]CAD5110564.1 hypothetical protein PSEWESI4_04887 [Pseudomonas carbonaria]